MKRSHPSRALRAGEDFGVRGDGPESPPLAKGNVDDYGETVLTRIAEVTKIEPKEKQDE